MKCKITISMDNAAFEDGEGKPELARILRRLADKVEAGDEPPFLYDVNGNKVGKCEVTK
jgi:hypothetical protein